MVVFRGAEFKFTGPNTWNLVIYLLLTRPQGPKRGKNGPKKPQIIQNDTFCLVTFICPLNFS